jgi:dUTPase
VVDEDYQGEVHLHVRNISTDVQFIDNGTKLVQAILVPVLYEDVEEVESEEELFPEKTVRGEGGFGSTGTD